MLLPNRSSLVVVVGLVSWGLFGCTQGGADSRSNEAPSASAHAAEVITARRTPIPVPPDPADFLKKPIQDADELIAAAKANPTAFDGKIFTVRGRFTTHGMDAGFPLVHFAGPPNNGNAKNENTCRGEFSPGEDGDSYPRNTVILMTGTLSVSATHPSDSLLLTDCKTKRER